LATVVAQVVAILKKGPHFVHDFDKMQIRQVLSGKPDLLAVAFATTCARRMINSLGETPQDSSDVESAHGALATLEEFMTLGKTLPADLKQQIVDLIPDEDEDPSFAGGILDDALAALSFAIRATTVSPIECACDAAARALDTAFRFSSQTLNDRLLTDTAFRIVMESPTVQCELERQHRDLADIAEPSRPVEATIELLLTRSAGEAVLLREE
jgi:hypothetical protein